MADYALMDVGDGASSLERYEDQRHQKQQLKSYRHCFICLIVLVLLLTGGLLYFVMKRYVFHHNDNHPGSSILPTGTEDGVVSMLDTTTNPCDDFYQYACGGWLNNFQLNGTEFYGIAFTAINRVVQAQQLSILSENFPFIGTFYDSCLDVSSTDSLGNEAIAPFLSLIDGVSSVEALYDVLGTLQMQGLARTAFFPTTLEPDFGFANLMRLYWVGFGGYTLSSTDEYTDPASLALLISYVKAAFVALGNTGPQAAQKANNVVQFEILLAELERNETDLLNSRNPLDFYYALTHTLYATPNEMEMFSGLPVNTYISSLTGSSLTSSQLNVWMGVLYSGTFPKLSALLNSTDMGTLCDYLRWHTLVGVMDFLPSAFRNISFNAAMNDVNLGIHAPITFDFSHPVERATTTTDIDGGGGVGTSGDVDVDVDVTTSSTNAKKTSKKSSPSSLLSNFLPSVNATRPQFCLQQTLSYFSDFLSHEWVVTSFPPENYAGAVALINLIYPQMGVRLQTVSWLDDATRAQAIQKWQEIVINIAYNTDWLDYAGLSISQGQILSNYAAVSRFLNLKQYAKIGAAPNRNDMPTTDFMQQNAFYSPQSNSINMLAGLILPPAFDADLPMMLNLASYGMVIGHELTHGFDNSGRNYNGTGAYVDWWSSAAVSQFVTRAQCLISQYDTFPVFDKTVNGQFTLGENIADLGGIGLAWAAYQAHATEATQLLSFLNNDQYFFLHYAQTWCAKNTITNAYMRLATDVHSPAKWRINGPLSNLPAFAQSFQCPANSFMGRSLTSNRCEVW